MLCPAKGKAVSRRRGQVTFIQYRRKMCSFSRRRGKAVSRRRESCFPAPGKGWPGVGWFDLSWVILMSNTAKTWFHNADELHGWCHASWFFRRRRKSCPGAGKAFFPAPGKGQPGAGWPVCLVKNQFVVQVTFVPTAKLLISNKAKT